MTASEFSFLALGLILGVVSGAALMELVRARPPVPREVRLTVAHDAIPRRSTTLADDAFISTGGEPARGGPADRRWVGGPPPPGATERRTTVRLGVAAAAAGGGPSMAMPIVRASGARATTNDRAAAAKAPRGEVAAVRDVRPGGASSGIPISTGSDPVFGAIVTAAVATPSGAAPIAAAPSTAVALLDPPAGAGGSPAPAATGPCAEERRLAEERCELATRARALAEAASDALRHAQRAYDAHDAAALEAAARADPRAIQAAKEAAQIGFREAVRSATTPEANEAAARDWLNEINRINTEARDAAAVAAREHATAVEIATSLERLGLEADAARIAADNADSACLAARQAVAECDERVNLAEAAYLVPPRTPEPMMPALVDDETLGLALEAGQAPRIFRLLHGDREAMTTLVAAVAGDDPEARRRWQLHLTGLVEAIVANAIEAGSLDFPGDHPFWGTFTRIQSRDITQALSSLGFRFDGLGGWTDGRYPSQRDLSLALGYAGLDPMRVRHWPNEEATATLFGEVTVAADEYLAGAAGDLTLGEMVSMLGRRADGLAEVWNQWGRLRPLLLEEA